MFRRSVLFAAAFVLGCGAASTAQADDKPAPRRVQALLIGATQDPEIGAGVSANLQVMERLLRGLPGFDPKRDLVVLSRDEELTYDNIMNVVDRLKVDGGDTMFCYIACHGAYEERGAYLDDRTKGHFFQLPGGQGLVRDSFLKELRREHSDSPPFLTVLISDTCNMPARLDCGCDPVMRAAPSMAPIASPVFADLLQHQCGKDFWPYKGRGAVDVSGSSHGQYGWYQSDGGWFTIGLVRALGQLDAEAAANYTRYGTAESTELLDSNGNLRNSPGPFAEIGWKRFLDEVSVSASEVFQDRKRFILAAKEPKDPKQVESRRKLRNQADQRPQLFRQETACLETALTGTQWNMSGGLDGKSWVRYRAWSIEFLPRGQFILTENGVAKKSVDMRGKCSWRQYGNLVIVESEDGHWCRLKITHEGQHLQGTSKQSPTWGLPLPPPLTPVPFEEEEFDVDPGPPITGYRLPK